MIEDIEGTKIITDDILIWGRTMTEHGEGLKRVVNKKVGRKTLRSPPSEVPDLIQGISWEEGQHKDTSIKTSQATARGTAISHTGGHL